MYCGDGINDLVALASADVGMAVGSSHASAAASVSDRHSSVAGKLPYPCIACIMSESAHETCMQLDTSSSASFSDLLGEVN